MEEKKLNFDLQDYWQHRDRLQELVGEYLVDNPQPLVTLAKKINIHYMTLRRILNNQGVDFRVWCKVLNFLKKESIKK